MAKITIKSTTPPIMRGIIQVILDVPGPVAELQTKAPPLGLHSLVNGQA